MNKKVFMLSSAISALLVCFLLCRYVFFNMHGMKQWTFVLFVFGLIVILVASIFKSKITMYAPPVGYIVGFALAIRFNTDGVDPGGGTTNNAWIIWTSTLLIVVTISSALSIAQKVRAKAKN